MANEKLTELNASAHRLANAQSGNVLKISTDMLIDSLMKTTIGKKIEGALGDTDATPQEIDAYIKKAKDKLYQTDGFINGVQQDIDNVNMLVHNIISDCKGIANYITMAIANASMPKSIGTCVPNPLSMITELKLAVEYVTGKLNEMLTSITTLISMLNKYGITPPDALINAISTVSKVLNMVNEMTDTISKLISGPARFVKAVKTAIKDLKSTLKDTKDDDDLSKYEKVNAYIEAWETFLSNFGAREFLMFGAVLDLIDEAQKLVQKAIDAIDDGSEFFKSIHLKSAKELKDEVENETD